MSQDTRLLLRTLLLSAWIHLHHQSKVWEDLLIPGFSGLFHDHLNSGAIRAADQLFELCSFSCWVFLFIYSFIFLQNIFRYVDNSVYLASEMSHTVNMLHGLFVNLDQQRLSQNAKMWRKLRWICYRCNLAATFLFSFVSCLRKPKWFNTKDVKLFRKLQRLCHHQFQRIFFIYSSIFFVLFFGSTCARWLNPLFWNVLL